MKMRTLLPCILLILVPAWMTVSAVEVSPPHDVTVTYTADDHVNSWWLKNSSGTALLPTGTNQGVWQATDSHTMGLDPYQTNEFIWEIFNFASNTGGYSPAGFLGQIAASDPDAPGPALSSGDWYVALPNPQFTGLNFDVLSWVPASPYGSNDSDGNPWSYVAGIDDRAEWIWTENNDPDKFVNNYAFVKSVISAVPIPSAAWLLGTGLVGLVAFRRKFGG